MAFTERKLRSILGKKEKMNALPWHEGQLNSLKMG
jgi:hypothetical protein